MCPLCIGTATLLISSSTSSGGVVVALYRFRRRVSTEVDRLPARAAVGDQLVGLLLHLWHLRLLNAIADFFSMHCHISRRIDPKPDLISIHTHHSDGNIRSNHERLADPPRENQHLHSP